MDVGCAVVDDTPPEAGLGEVAEAVQGGEDLSPAEVGLLAMGSVLVELVRAVEVLAPGRFDRALQASRLRLQQIEAGRIAPVFASEAEVLRKRVDIFERGQGRPASQD